MTEDEIKKAANALVSELYRRGSRPECNLTIGGDTYKPFYRTMSIIWAPSTFITEYCNGKPLSFKDTLLILKQADSFFKEALKDADEVKHLESQYENAKESWEDQYE
jgi:hypothetical protein